MLTYLKHLFITIFALLTLIILYGYFTGETVKYNRNKHNNSFHPQS